MPCSRGCRPSTVEGRCGETRTCVFLSADRRAVDLVVVAVTHLAAGHRGQQGAEQDEDRGDDAAGSELVGRDWDPGQADAVEYVVLRPEHGPEHESDDRDREPD